MRHRIEPAILPRRREAFLPPAPGSRQASVSRNEGRLFADSLYLHIAVAAGVLWLVLRVS